MNVGALRALVIGLAVLILIVFAAVVYGIVGLAAPDSNGEATAEVAEVAGEAAPGLRNFSLNLPDGCEIRNARSDGNRLTIVTDGPANLRATCMRVWVIDIATGETLAEIRP